MLNSLELCWGPLCCPPPSGAHSESGLGAGERPGAMPTYSPYKLRCFHSAAAALAAIQEKGRVHLVMQEL